MSFVEAFVELRTRGDVAWIRRDLAALGAAPFWAAVEPIAGAKGRGGVGRLQVGGVELVVRPYRRGGAFGRLLDDRYPSAVRARRELELLQSLREDGVPVVVPVAALGRRRRAFWRLRLCTEWLAESLPLPAFLAAHPAARRRAVEAVGVVLRLAFAAGLRHPDLHPDNVLCRDHGDKVRAVLVDLDRAQRGAPVTPAQRDAMLARMRRYVVRHQKRLAAVPTRAESLRFLRALGLDRRERHELWRRVDAQVQRTVRRRRWLRR
ncbi:MAG: phosphotransferase [Planctomycetes bacterium]|nr:phosphotransferase [Planctomycetota bacterium]